jgi:DNA-directed RNA polymerase subunit omega
MARITVEDCLEHVENRFALVYTTSKRTKELIRGATPLYKCDNKEIVTALREIAALKVTVVKQDKETPAKTKKH